MTVRISEGSVMVLGALAYITGMVSLLSGASEPVTALYVGGVPAAGFAAAGTAWPKRRGAYFILAALAGLLTMGLLALAGAKPYC